MEAQCYSVNNSLKHQTGVTERSISSNDRQPAKRVVDDVVIGHDADRIGARGVADPDRDYFFGAVELSLYCGRNSERSNGWNIQFVNIDTRRDSARKHENGEQRIARLGPYTCPKA